MKCPTSIRHAVLAAALAAFGATTIALPATAHAGIVAPEGRKLDGVAELASHALGVLSTSSANSDMDAYEEERSAIAGAIADRLGIDAGPLRAAWASADLDHQRALLAALSQMGVPYRRNTSKVGVSFDCSGLTTYAWAQAGISLQRSSSAQIRAATQLTPETAQAGDLVWYPGHISMWLGVDRAMVHSPYTGRTVEVTVFSAKKSLKFADPTS